MQLKLNLLQSGKNSDTEIGSKSEGHKEGIRKKTFSACADCYYYFDMMCENEVYV